MIILLGCLFFYVVGIFVVGIPMSKKSIKVWQKNHTSGDHRFWEYVLFPGSASDDRIGHDSMTFIHDYDFGDENARRDYIGISATLWLFRLLWNVFVLAVLGILAIFSLIPKTIGKLVRNP